MAILKCFNSIGSL